MLENQQLGDSLEELRYQCGKNGNDNRVGYKNGGYPGDSLTCLDMKRYASFQNDQLEMGHNQDGYNQLKYGEEAPLFAKQKLENEDYISEQQQLMCCGANLDNGYFSKIATEMSDVC